jgi:hypothetical protein
MTDLRELEREKWWTKFHEAHLQRHGVAFFEMPDAWLNECARVGVFHAPEHPSKWCACCDHFRRSPGSKDRGECRVAAPRRSGRWPEAFQSSFCGRFVRREQR